MTAANLREHTFDGIQEMDNRLPNWWLWSLYLACLFSLFYWLHFHTLGTGNLPAEAWVREEQEGNERMMAELAKNPVTEELLLKLAAEPALVAEGEKIFRNPALCAQCHKEDGSGNIGPNLTDRLWIHGGSAMEIYDVVWNGRQDKGMQAWKSNGMQFVQRAVVYVLSIRGRNLPGKPPEPNAREYPTR